MRRPPDKCLLINLLESLEFSPTPCFTKPPMKVVETCPHGRGGEEEAEKDEKKTYYEHWPIPDGDVSLDIFLQWRS